MKRVTGIGGIFFKSKDPKKLQEWYRVHLGLEIEAWGGVAFKWVTPENPGGVGTTVWNAFDATTTHLGPGPAPFVINYRVHDLHALIAALKEEGCEVDPKTDDSEYGKFGWVTDPDGNRVELWQPPDGQ